MIGKGRGFLIRGLMGPSGIAYTFLRGQRSKTKWLKGIAFVVAVGCVMSVTGTGCVSPFYGTARIEKGFHTNCGLSGMNFIMEGFDSWDYYYVSDVRGDCEMSYGINKYLQFHSRFAAGLGTGLGEYPIFDGGIGFQTALPTRFITPALRAEVSLYGLAPTVSPTLLLGIGEIEWLTLGARVHLFGDTWEKNTFPEYHQALEHTPTDFFVSAHMFKKWTIFAGSQLFYHSYQYQGKKPVFTVGLGYKLK